MNTHNERERIFLLMSLYENLLTDAQKKALVDHYEYDLSFGEISKENGISRAAANDNLKAAIAKMEEYEEKLHLVEKYKLLKKISSMDEKLIKKELQKFIGEVDGI